MSRSTALALSAVVALGPLVLSGDLAAQQSARVLAPGVLTVITPKPEAGETFTGPIKFAQVATKHPEVEFAPKLNPPTATIFDKAQRVTLRYKIWSLEFAFKPLRMVYVDVPESPGVIKRKLVWYMAYRIRNTGMHLAPVAHEDATGHVTYTMEPPATTPSGIPGMPDGKAFFFPHFVLEGEFYDTQSSTYVRRAYLDRVIPEARAVIQQREDPAIPLYNTVEMMRRPLAHPTAADELSDANTAWGVVTWMDVNPHIDFASIYVQGLTNAFEFTDKPDGSGALYRHKTLQLNFWRPGDQYLEHEKEIRYGVPLVPDEAEQAKILNRYGITERLDNLWVYR
jgi:hypothetical protein